MKHYTTTGGTVNGAPDESQNQNAAGKLTLLDKHLFAKAARACRTLLPTDKLVLATILDHLNIDPRFTIDSPSPKGGFYLRCDPSQIGIAEEIGGVSLRTVTTSIKNLRTKGWITAIFRPGLRTSFTMLWSRAKAADCVPPTQSTAYPPTQSTADELGNGTRELNTGNSEQESEHGFVTPQQDSDAGASAHRRQDSEVESRSSPIIPSTATASVTAPAKEAGLAGRKEGQKSRRREAGGGPDRTQHAFEHYGVKLTQHALDKLRVEFPHVDVATELPGILKWAVVEGRGDDWYHPAYAALAKLNADKEEHHKIQTGEITLAFDYAALQITTEGYAELNKAYPELDLEKELQSMAMVVSGWDTEKNDGTMHRFSKKQQHKLVLKRLDEAARRVA